MLSVPNIPANFRMLSQHYSCPVPAEPSGSASCLPDYPRNHYYALEECILVLTPLQITKSFSACECLYLSSSTNYLYFFLINLVLSGTMNSSLYWLLSCNRYDWKRSKLLASLCLRHINKGFCFSADFFLDAPLYWH